MPSDDLLSHDSEAALSSALSGFTSEFGMVSGGTRSLWSPGKSAILPYQLREAIRNQEVALVCHFS